MSSLKAFFVCSLLGVFLFAPFVSRSQTAEVVEGELFVKVMDHSSEDLTFHPSKKPNDTRWLHLIQAYKIQEIRKAFKLKDAQLQRIYLLKFDETRKATELIRAIHEIDYIDYAERVPAYELEHTPNDLDPQQWSLTKIQAQQAWDQSTGSPNIVIAIVDDAVLLTHEDLAANIWVNAGEVPGNGADDDNNGYIDDLNGWDAADDDNDPAPPASATSSNFSHGTHCAGIAAGVTNNGKGIASIGYSVKIMAVKTKQSSTTGPSLQAPYEGVEYAIAAGANVISMSWGGFTPSNTYQLLFNNANTRGIVLVAAAGNSDTYTPHYPSSYDYVIGVGATDEDDLKASLSNYNRPPGAVLLAMNVDVMAPGTNILSAVAGSNSAYDYKSGTSMACPLVAGLAALMRSKYSQISPYEIELCLKNTAENIDAQNPNYINQLGAGRINAYQAIACVKPVYADFEALLTSSCPGGTISFIDKSRNSPTSYQWFFPGGNPASSQVQNPSVTYGTAGSYPVTLIVSNSDGTDTLVKNNYITIGPPGANISGSASILTGQMVNLRIDFTGSPPWSFSYTDGTGSDTISGINHNPYYLTVQPASTSTYTITSVSDRDCGGTGGGSAVVTVNSLVVPCYHVKGYQKINQTEGNLTGTLEGQDWFGWSSAIIGDIDGDGIDDVVVGAIGDDDGGTDRGALWILFLNANGTVKSHQKISSTQGNFNGIPQNGYGLGKSVALIGDIDGDGINDIAAGAPSDLDGGMLRGAVWLLMLNSDGTVKSHKKISTTQGNFTGVLAPGDSFGGSVAGIGDIDGDGISDLAVGAVGTDDGGANLSGGIWVLLLNADGTVKSQQKISNGNGNFSAYLDEGDNFGAAVTGLGDLDDDGTNDIAVGSLLDDDGGTDKGAVWIFFLNPDGSIKSQQKISATEGNFNGLQTFGASLFSRALAAKDLDKDGIMDLAVGANQINEVWLLLLKRDGTVKAQQGITRTQGSFTGTLNNGDFFGSGLSFSDDINGDGMADLFVGANGDSDNGYGMGAGWVVNLMICDTICSVDAGFSFEAKCLGDSSLFFDNSTDRLESSEIVTWEWDFGDGSSATGIQNPKHLYASEGAYQVTLVASNDNGAACYDTIAKYITINDSLKASITAPSTVCSGDSIAIALNVSCGMAPFSYKWMPASGLSSDTILSPAASPGQNTTYYVTVTDAQGNTATDSLTITVDFGCCVSHAVINADKVIYCVGEAVNFTNNSVASAGAVYNWNFGTNASPSSYIGANPPPVFYSTDSVYFARLILTDNCGADTAYKLIPVLSLPAADAGSDATLCPSDTIQIGSTPVSSYRYEWLPAAGLSDSQSANPFAYPNSNALFILTVTDDATGCSNTDTISIQYLDCDDGEACTADDCDPVSGCDHIASACDDNDPCTIDDCDSIGGCSHTAVSCDDNDACTDDRCGPSPVVGCNYTPISCDDNNACSTDVCDPAAGCFHFPAECDDHVACTNDTCDPVSGCINDLIPCDDNDCSTTDEIDSLCQCIHTPVSPPDCDDNNCGTDDSYNSFTCLCVNTALPPPNCDDSSCLTIDAYNPQTCGCEHDTVLVTEAVFGYSDSALIVLFYDSTLGATFWKWDFGDEESSSSRFPVHTYAEEGEYQVCLTVGNDCYSVKECIFITVTRTGIGMMSDFGLNIFPNPFSATAEVVIDGNARDVSLHLYDMLGRKIKSYLNQPGNFSISREGMTEGMYLYEIAIGENRFFGKVLVTD